MSVQRRPWQLLRELSAALAVARGDRRVRRRRRSASTSATTTSSSPSCPTCSASSTARGAAAAGRRRQRRRRCACSGATTCARCACCRAPGDAPITLRGRACRPVLLLRRRHRAAQRRGRPPTTCRWRDAQELLYRFGRAYPSGWDAAGRPLHCAGRRRMARSPTARCWRAPTRRRAKPSWRFVGEHRAPRIAAHWEFCSSRWCPTIPSTRARCAIARSSTTACR